MNQQTKGIIEILKKPADYSVERVSRALVEILEITGRSYQTSGHACSACMTGGEQNG
jgi:hypothetical protein